MPSDPCYAPGPRDRTVRHPDGRVIAVPEGWALLPPGDAGLTRKVKSLGDAWTVKEKRGRRMFSRGVWADAAQIETARELVEAQRASPAHQRKLDAGRRRREKAQAAYVVEFRSTVRRFLSFHPTHRDLEAKMAEAIATHATPVGSGTVARTQRISVERRAEAATIAWMRHQTTAYDHMHIPRVKGKRREVRRMLAERSRALLKRYRTGAPADPSDPLQTALSDAPEATRHRAPVPAVPPSTLSPQSDHEAAQREKYEQVRARLAARTSRRRK
ncbi:MAG TPA: DUF2293 domain-containing protein [Deltaproteobacteria bacterium]|nr:DUF2293 domain-containing protein [Deltaproteobacteria bacterium]